MLLLILITLGFIKVIALYRGYHIVPLAELKRRSRGKEIDANKLYKVAVFGKSLDLFLWMLGVTLASTVFIMSARSSWWLATLMIVVFGWILFWAPKPKPRGLTYKYVVLSAPFMYKLMLQVRPLTDAILSVFPNNQEVHFHTGLYEKSDLLEIIQNQNKQTDSRIPKEDLEIAKNALNFGDKLVSDIMTSRGKLRFVKENEAIGPMLMDELHKTEQTIFPVIKESSNEADPQVIGSLHLTDLIANPDKPRVKDVMQTGKHHISEDSDLRTCLEELVKQKAQLLIVINHFEEVSGAITLAQVFEQIIGKKLPTEDGAN